MKFGMQAVLTAVPGKGNELADIMTQAASAVAEKPEEKEAVAVDE